MKKIDLSKLAHVTGGAAQQSWNNWNNGSQWNSGSQWNANSWNKSWSQK